MTNQTGPEPPLEDSQIVAVAFSVGEHFVVLPERGTALQETQNELTLVQRHAFPAVGIGGVQGLAVSTFALTTVRYVVSVWRDHGPDPNGTDDSGVSSSAAGRSSSD